MKSFSGRVLLGGVTSGFLFLGAASCSSSTSPTGGTGNETSSGGNSSVNQNHGGSGAGTSIGGGGQVILGGGGSGTSVGGGQVILGGGGTSVGGGGQVIPGGGSPSTAGSGGAATVAMCSTDPNLVNATGCFVGCDPTVATDNPQGLQGAFYTYGDGSSCASTMPVAGSGPPCSTMGVCLSGTTVVDATYAKWGCGIGFELNSTGGTTPMKLPYSGPATCFDYTLTGNPGQNEIRVAFTQSADTAGKVSPYKSILPTAWKNGTYSATVCMKDVACNNQMNCTPPATSAYDLQIGVVGGNAASGTYNVCLTSLKPSGSAASTLNPIVSSPCPSSTPDCTTKGTGPASMETIGKYFVQTNINNDSGGSLTLTPSANGFTVNSASLQDPGNQPAAYPSIVDGWHYGAVSSDTTLPILLSKLNTAQSSVTYSGSNGKYDASYDIWVLPSANPKTPSGGLEVMLWLNDSGVQPSGSQTATFTPPGGSSWAVWTATQSGGWKYVAYLKTGQNSFTGDLAPFIQDAATRQGIPQSDYLAGIQFGFELWQGGGSFAVNSFSSTVTSK